MGRIVCLLILGMVWINGWAQAAGSNNPRIVQQISQAAAAMKSMQCDFVQTKHMKMLGEKMVSKGKMYYQQPNRLRWEYVAPYKYVFLLNGQQVTIKKGDRKDVIDVNRSKVFREIARIMMSSVVGTCLTNSKDFKVSIGEQGGSYMATLIPQKKELKQMYAKLQLTFSKTTNSVTRVMMFEKNGDYTDILLQNIITNKNINNGIFTVK